MDNVPLQSILRSPSDSILRGPSPFCIIFEPLLLGCALTYHPPSSNKRTFAPEPAAN